MLRTKKTPEDNFQERTKRRKSGKTLHLSFGTPFTCNMELIKCAAGSLLQLTRVKFYLQAAMGGKHFGELYKVRGLITYKISPFEQRAFAGFISHGIANTIRRFRGQALRVIPPFIATYLIYDSVEKQHHHMLRKNPADYENDNYLDPGILELPFEKSAIFGVSHGLSRIFDPAVTLCFDQSSADA
ncbi:Hypothetical predicted protein [Cloeon dipterum]|uniref:Cytochrome b-c1 complex subunit 8 n=1 Tax=Cloeon dipterum TaxID=197152 RepID=A0A8S1CB87_9INSE|nr:Hypothetical predicted protein [Cloeon dipterum]